MANPTAVSKETQALADYLVSMQTREIPEDVDRKARQHILDTVASMVSGSVLLPGEMGYKFVKEHSTGDEALVIGTDFITDAVSAALANGMSAHADETDDSHAPSLGHPGCGVVPAALAVAERNNSSGKDLVRAVVAGYDVGTRLSFALGLQKRLASGTSALSSHAIVSLFGAMGAAAVLEKLDEQQCRYAFSYTAQMASGVTSWLRDGRHVEKAYVFAGMPAHAGVKGVLMASAGLDGVEDVFFGDPNFLEIMSPDDADISQIADGLGTNWEIMRTNIKKYSIGSPAQAAVQAMANLVAEHDLKHTDAESIEIRIPSNAAHVVDSRSMPDINVQYLVAGTLVDGDCTFQMAHDEDRLNNDPTILDLISRTTLVADEEMEPVRQAKVAVKTANGEVSNHVPFVRGTIDDPMTNEEIEAKAYEISETVIGGERAQKLIDAIRDLDQVGNVVELREWLRN